MNIFIGLNIPKKVEWLFINLSFQYLAVPCNLQCKSLMVFKFSFSLKFLLFLWKFCTMYFGFVQSFLQLFPNPSCLHQQLMFVYFIIKIKCTLRTMCIVNIFLDVWYSTRNVKIAKCSYPMTGQQCRYLIPEANTIKPQCHEWVVSFEFFGH